MADRKDLQIVLGVSLSGVEKAQQTTVQAETRVKRVQQTTVIAAADVSRLEKRLEQIARSQLKSVAKSVVYSQLTEFANELLPNTDSNIISALARITTQAGIGGIYGGGAYGAIAGGFIGVLQELRRAITAGDEKVAELEEKNKEQDRFNEDLRRRLASAEFEITVNQRRLVQDEARKRYLELRTVI